MSIPQNIRHGTRRGDRKASLYLVPAGIMERPRGYQRALSYRMSRLSREIQGSEADDSYTVTMPLLSKDFGLSTSAFFVMIVSSKPELGRSELVGHLQRTEYEAAIGLGKAFEATMKTQGEVEAAICEGMSRFEQEYMGRGPKDIRAFDR